MQAINHCAFEVKNHRMRVTSMKQFECRGDNAIEIVQALVSLAPDLFEGTSAYVSFHDMPPETRLPANFDRVFCSTLRLGEPCHFLPFPCPYSLRWPQVGIPDGSAMLAGLLDHSAPWLHATAFWIGAETHPSRRRLVDIARKHPGKIDASIMSWDRSKPDALSSNGRYVSLPDHCHYKYLIDCPGIGYSARLRWLLATGRPVFIVERSSIEPWHLHLRPWLHYIPVRQDMADLVSNLERIESDPRLYSLISANAREFVRRRLTPGMELDRLATHLGNPSIPY